MSEHKTELRERVAYRVNESWCVEPGCEFFDQLAVQGHCHSRLDDETDRLVDRMEKNAESSLAFYRAEHPDDADYLKVLESMYVCAMMNWESCLDQLVRLRKENATLKKAQAR